MCRAPHIIRNYKPSYFGGVLCDETQQARQLRPHIQQTPMVGLVSFVFFVFAPCTIKRVDYLVTPSLYVGKQQALTGVVTH